MRRIYTLFLNLTGTVLPIKGANLPKMLSTFLNKSLLLFYFKPFFILLSY